MSKISRTLVVASALSFAAVPAVVAGETDGSECIDVSAAEPSCSPDKYQGRLDDMAKHSYERAIEADPGSDRAKAALAALAAAGGGS